MSFQDTFAESSVYVQLIFAVPLYPLPSISAFISSGLHSFQPKVSDSVISSESDCSNGAPLLIYPNLTRYVYFVLSSTVVSVQEVFSGLFITYSS